MGIYIPQVIRKKGMDEVKQRLLAECALGEVGAAKELYRLAGRQEDWKSALIALRVLSTESLHENSQLDLDDIVKKKFDQYLMGLIKPTHQTTPTPTQESLRDYIEGIKGFYQTSQVCLFDTKLDDHSSLTCIDSIFPISFDLSPDIECSTYFMFYLYIRDPDFDDSSLKIDLDLQTSHQFMSPYSSSYQSFPQYNSVYFQGGISSILSDKIYSYFDFSQHLTNNDSKFCKFSVSLSKKPPYQMMMRCDLINKIHFG